MRCTGSKVLHVYIPQGDHPGIGHLLQFIWHLLPYQGLHGVGKSTRLMGTLPAVQSQKCGLVWLDNYHDSVRSETHRLCLDSKQSCSSRCHACSSGMPRKVTLTSGFSADCRTANVSDKALYNSHIREVYQQSNIGQPGGYEAVAGKLTSAHLP